LPDAYTYLRHDAASPDSDSVADLDTRDDGHSPSQPAVFPDRNGFGPFWSLGGVSEFSGLTAVNHKGIGRISLTFRPLRSDGAGSDQHLPGHGMQQGLTAGIKRVGRSEQLVLVSGADGDLSVTLELAQTWREKSASAGHRRSRRARFDISICDIPGNWLQSWCGLRS
jgi:hypothetical protein